MIVAIAITINISPPTATPIARETPDEVSAFKKLTTTPFYVFNDEGGYKTRISRMQGLRVN